MKPEVVPPTILACRGCDQEFFFVNVDVPIHYVVPSFGRFAFHGQKAWCYSCQTVVDAERKMLPSKIRVEIDALKKIGRARTAMQRLKDFGKLDREITRLIREKLNLVEMAKFRESPPRCLQCLKCTILPLRFDDEGDVSSVVHRCGSGLFKRLIDEDSASIHWGRIEYALSPEGNPISTVVEDEEFNQDLPALRRVLT